MLSTWPFTITTRNQLKRKRPWAEPQASKHWQCHGPPLRYQNHIAIEHNLIILCNKNVYFIDLFLIYKLPCWARLRGPLSILTHTHTRMPVAQKQRNSSSKNRPRRNVQEIFFFVEQANIYRKKIDTPLKCIAWRKGAKKMKCVESCVA